MHPEGVAALLTGAAGLGPVGGRHDEAIVVTMSNPSWAKDGQERKAESCTAQWDLKCSHVPSTGLV